MVLGFLASVILFFPNVQVCLFTHNIKILIDAKLCIVHLSINTKVWKEMHQKCHHTSLFSLQVTFSSCLSALSKFSIKCIDLHNNEIIHTLKIQENYMHIFASIWLFHLANLSVFHNKVAEHSPSEASCFSL